MLTTADPFVMLAATILSVTLLAFSIGYLINWYRKRAVMSSYKRVGFYVALIVLGYELLTLALIVSSRHLYQISVVSLVLAIGWLMLRLWAFTNNGIFYSNQLGIRSFPLVAPRLGTAVAPQAAVPTVDQNASQLVEQPAPEVDTPIGAEGVPPQPIESEATLVEPIATETPPIDPIDAPPISSASMTSVADTAFVASTAPAARLNWRSYWLTILAVGVGAALYSAILFMLTLPGVGDLFREAIGSGARVTPLTLVMILEFAFTEEIFFRLGIQNFIAAKLVRRRRGYEIAIVITAILWTLGHVGVLNPDWVKLAQVFPIGLALGWLYRRYGTESTIIAHSLFNLLGGLLLSPLFLR